MYGQHASQLYVFCSDSARNGKSLLCRLLASYLPDDGAGKSIIFDTDFPEGRVGNFFPDRSEIIDFSHTMGQMRIFDTIIANEHSHYVVDLQSHHLRKFFEIYSHIDFEEAASEANVNVVVYYLLDKEDRSISVAQEILAGLNSTEMVLVENDFIAQHNTREEIADYHGELFNLRKVRLPILSSDLLRILEEPSFSLHAFMSGKDEGMDYETKLELWNLLEFFYSQRGADRTGRTHLI